MVIFARRFQIFGFKTDVFAQKNIFLKHEGKCAVVKLICDSKHTTIRADGSASRGNAMEETEVGQFLLPIKTPVSLDDKFVIDKVEFRVSRIRNQYDSLGNLHHLEVGCSSWVN